MLFSFPAQQKIASALLHEVHGLEQRPFEVRRFENQELHVLVPSPLIGERCFLLGSIAPPEEQMTAFTLVAHTLREQGAGPIVALLPYLAYSRQDKTRPGESLAAAWAGALLKASGVDQVLTIDLHSERDKELFPIPLLTLSPANLIADEIKRRGLEGATIVAPDNGAVTRCKAVKRSLCSASEDILHLQKKRTDAGVIHDEMSETVGTRVVIIDDILDTGGTLISACETLICAGAEEIHIFATHGLFTGEKWKRLWALRVQHIFCTDTIPPSACNAGDERVTTLSVATLLGSQLSSHVDQRFQQPALEISE